MNTAFFKNISPTVTARLSTLKIDVPSTYGQKAMDELLKGSVLKGGKRLRPLLTFLFAQYFGIDLKRVDIFARAIEMVHAASLAHDDVIDGASQRRGRDSINIQASNKKAVLAGDYLLASVIGELSRDGSLEHVQEMAKVIELLSQGEWLQADLVESRDYTAEVIREVALKKTSSVMSWCAISSALLCPERDKLLPLCREFGECLGIAFQYLDDTFDFQEGGEKDGFLDLKNGQVNAVLFHWLKENPEMFKRFKEGEDLSQTLMNEGSFYPESAIKEVKLIATGNLNRCAAILDEMDEVLSERLNEKTLSRSRKTFDFIFKFLETRTY